MPESAASKPLRVCTLNSSYEGSQSAMKEYDDFFFSPELVLKDDSSYVFSSINVMKATAYSQIRDIVKQGSVDVFVNLCDGAKDEDRAGVAVVQALEEFNVAFTGSDSKHYEPSKVEMKILSYYAGIKVPDFATVGPDDNIAEVCAHLKFPVIVKHVSGYGSIGMSKDSRCPNLAHLEREAARFITMFGEALVEEFIEGTEINVLACEDANGVARVFEPIRVEFPAGETFKHFELKWIDFADCQWGKPVNDQVLAEKVKQVGLAAFQHILGGIGYGRCDLRVSDETGEVYLLEINPNCGLFSPLNDCSADMIINLDPIGGAGFARLLIDAAIARHQRGQKKKSITKVQHHPGKGYHIVAARSVNCGELVFSNENTPHVLVSPTFVRENWNAHDKEDFARFAWPVSEHVFSTWTNDPRDWKPINHSCDPNLWFGESHSLNVYARRDIQAGQELTMDYATFCSGPYMKPFPCSCKASICRRRITGLDYSDSQAIQSAYGTRVTGYIYNQWNNRTGNEKYDPDSIAFKKQPILDYDIDLSA